MLETNKPVTDMKKRLEDILLFVSWREILRAYFGKSSHWIYKKMNAIDGTSGID